MKALHIHVRFAAAVSHPTPSAYTSTWFGTGRKIGNLILSNTKPRGIVKHSEDDQVFRCDLLQIRRVGDCEGSASCHALVLRVDVRVDDAVGSIFTFTCYPEAGMILTISKQSGHCTIIRQCGESAVNRKLDGENAVGWELEELALIWRELVAIVSMMKPPVRFVEHEKRLNCIIGVLVIDAWLRPIQTIHPLVPCRDMRLRRMKYIEESQADSERKKNPSYS